MPVPPEKIKFNRRLSAEYADHYLEPSMIHVNILNISKKIREGPVCYPDCLILLILCLNLRGMTFSICCNITSISSCDNATDLIPPTKPVTLRRLPDKMPRLVVQFHLNKNVSLDENSLFCSLSRRLLSSIIRSVGTRTLSYLIPKIFLLVSLVIYSLLYLFFRT